MNSKLTERSGFTLLELFVVMAIVAALCAIAIPSLAHQRVKSFNSSAVTDLRQFKTVMESYYSDNKAYPSF